MTEQQQRVANKLANVMDAASCAFGTVDDEFKTQNIQTLTKWESWLKNLELALNDENGPLGE